jgi:hypothetical protein
VAEPALAPFQAWGRKRLMADMRMRSLARIAALLTAVVSVSCTTGPTAAPTLDAVASSAPTAGPMASGTPQPTLQPRPVTHRLSEIVLPHHTVADVTVICDPYQDNSHESVCEDVIRWVIPAVAFATDDPVQRAYLRRGCAYRTVRAAWAIERRSWQSPQGSCGRWSSTTTPSPNRFRTRQHRGQRRPVSPRQTYSGETSRLHRATFGIAPRCLSAAVSKRIGSQSRSASSMRCWKVGPRK